VLPTSSKTNPLAVLSNDIKEEVAALPAPGVPENFWRVDDVLK
jgi:hypothetical protein